MDITNITVDKNLRGEALLTLDFTEGRIQARFVSGEPSESVSSKLRYLADEIAALTESDHD